MNDGGSIDESVTYIIELLHDKIRSLVKVAQPKSFDELRSIVAKLDEEKPYPLNPDKRKFVIEKVKEMENQGLIEPSSSGWASPIVLPKKKNGDYRLCVDLRQVNNKTIADAYPMPDLRHLIKQTDASNVGLGAVLFQERIEGGKDIIEYASRKLSLSEKSYCTAEKEALAVVWAVGKFRGYLEGRKFKLFTDNSSLQWLNKVSGTKSKLMLWSLILADFDFEIHHVPGELNQAADSLSRNPVDSGEISKELMEREVPVPMKLKQIEPVLMVAQRENCDIDLELIKKWQNEDAACSRMKSWITNRYTNSEAVPFQFKTCYKNFRLEDSILMYKSHLSESSPVIVVPKSQAVRILEKYHDSPEAGHPGQDETYTSIRRRFFWVNMHRDIKNYVQSCTICACTKANNQKASTSMRGRRPHQLWEVVALDLMGPYPRTSRGKTGILVVTDLFTRWVEAFAIPEATSGRILQLLRTEANPTERRNQELKELFRIHLFDKEHTKWDQHLHESLLAIRQRVNRVTGFSPAELFLGREIKRTGDWNFMHEQSPETMNLTAWHEENAKQIKRMNRQAEESSKREAERNDVPEEQDLKPGTLVLRRNHPLSNKLKNVHAGMARKWLGPFEVEHKLGKGVYLLRSDPPIKVHMSELKILPQTLREATQAEDNELEAEDHNDALPGYNLRSRKRKI
ncbi:uncharacterized protein LOC128998359 [Macrosteles quadrilineatus]|uniref:uncharacterized protein LOC128998359 n=1 Tax=Macrosteles quadrilineatus TaxID=74068 RepID=UPI0023E32E87|nr:uncharacterized protein LOC128998359 [Macrosteles quadrilineatus]